MPLPAHASAGPFRDPGRPHVLDEMTLDLRTSDARRRRARAFLLIRDGRECGRCHEPIALTETPSIGHVLARANGGADSLDNLRLEHLRCNVNAGAEGRFFNRAGTSAAGVPLPNGAQNGRLFRTTVLYREIPPDRRT
jgi:5-methylcytosine-specific restriction endonuclease McrA